MNISEKSKKKRNRLTVGCGQQRVGVERRVDLSTRAGLPFYVLSKWSSSPAMHINAAQACHIVVQRTITLQLLQLFSLGSMRFRRTMSLTFPLFTAGCLVPGFGTCFTSNVPREVTFASQRFWFRPFLTCRNCYFLRHCHCGGICSFHTWRPLGKDEGVLCKSYHQGERCTEYIPSCMKFYMGL